MKKNLIRKSAIIVCATMFLAGFLFIDSSAQKRRRRTRRRPSAPRITNPEIYQPSANDNSNSAADNANANTACSFRYRGLSELFVLIARPHRLAAGTRTRR